MVAGTVQLGSPIEPACVRVGRVGGAGWGRVNCCYRDGKTEPVNVCTWVPLSPAALQETSGQTSLQRSTRTVLLENVEGKSEMAAKPTICDKVYWSCLWLSCCDVFVCGKLCLGGSRAYRFAIYSSFVPLFHFFSHENICFLPSDPVSSFYYCRASLTCCCDGVFGKRASIDRPPCVCLMF